MWGSLYLLLGSPIGVVPFVYFAVSVGALVVFARTRNFGVLLRVELLDILLTTTLSAISLGGFIDLGWSGNVGHPGAARPLVFADARAGVRWFVAFVTVFLAAGIAGEALHLLAPLPSWFNSAMLGLNVAISAVIVFTLLAVFAYQRQAAMTALRAEQARSEGLLLNMLPRSIAEWLKAEPRTIADEFEAVSVLFADVVDFTPFAQRHAATDVVEALDDLFTRFDALAEHHGLEKIKTIGDSYMAAAGVPHTAHRPCPGGGLHGPRHDGDDASAGPPRLWRAAAAHRHQLRPAIAGVIGRTRFVYDLSGDAVNTASRMQSHGTPGHIQISRATYELIKTTSCVSRVG